MNQEKERKTIQITLLVLFFIVVASLSRFTCLNWSFAGDEVITPDQVKCVQTESLFARECFSPDAKSNFIGYEIQGLVYKIFGMDERGARMGAAIAGVLSIAFAVGVVALLYGYETATILGFLLLLSSWHLFHSQNARNYSYAFFSASFVLLSAALAWQKNSFWWGACSGLVSVLAGLTHNFAILLPMGLTFFVLLEKILARNSLARRAILGYVVVGGPFLLTTYGFIFWTLHNFKAVQGFWTYPMLHVLLGVFSDLEFSFVMMAILGGIWSLSRKANPIDRLWFSISLTIFGITCVAPFFLPFRPDYIFPCILAIFLLSARALANISQKIQESEPWYGRAFVFFFLLTAMPSFISYYQDGYRFDFRTAGKFIAENRKEEDRVASGMAALLQHYLPGPPMQVEEAYEFFHGRQEGLKLDGKRIWVVLAVGREGLPPNTDRWLWENGVRVKRIQKKRFDYHLHSTEIYLIQPKQK